VAWLPSVARPGDEHAWQKRRLRRWRGYGSSSNLIEQPSVERDDGELQPGEPLPRGAGDPTIAVVWLPGGRRVLRRVRERP